MTAREQIPAKVIIWQDGDCIDPRKDCDNLGTMSCKHRRYTLGDEQKTFEEVIDSVLPCETLDKLEKRKDDVYKTLRIFAMEGKMFDSEMRRLENQYDEWKMEAFEKMAIWLPVYMYEHSGVSISTSPFRCPWDSGQLGIIYATIEKAKKWFDFKVLTKKRRQQIVEALKSEVETYNYYVSAEVYGFRIEDADGETIDSCGGFFGSDHKKSGLWDHVVGSLPKDSPLRDERNWERE